MNFSEHLRQSENKKAKVLLEHCLFGNQVFHCDSLNIIDDNRRIGARIKGNDIFVYKQDAKVLKSVDNMFIISDGRLTITIIVNKL